MGKKPKSYENPNNGFIPKVGDKVRLVGACHPHALNKVVEVTAVFEDEGKWWFESKHYSKDFKGEFVYSSGILGGVEKVSDEIPIDEF